MKSLTKILALSVAVGAIGWAAPASAQASRTWVSGVGDDVNPCSRTAPCKTFAGAISKTATGGEINCLDPAGFGAVTITKSITIDCTGTLGGVLASSTTGVIVNGAGARVVLRGLTINGGPPNLPGVNGVRYLQGESLVMEQVHIMNFTAAAPNGFGIIVNATGLAKLYVTDSTIVNNGTAVSGGGILIAPSGAGGGSRVQLDNVRVVSNTFQGIRVDTGANPGVLDNFVQLNHVTISGSATGLNVLTPVGGSDASVMVHGSTISHNTTGVSASGNFSRTAMSDTNIFNNGTGLTASAGALIQSFGTNRLVSNPAGTSFNLPALVPQ